MEKLSLNGKSAT